MSHVHKIGPDLENLRGALNCLEADARRTGTAVPEEPKCGGPEGNSMDFLMTMLKESARVDDAMYDKRERPDSSMRGGAALLQNFWLTLSSW
jgi:hypothetical protein